MDKLATGLTILRHSFGVLFRHPRLLVFPAVSLVAALVVYVFFLAPLLFDATLGEIWYRIRLPDESWEAIAPWSAGDAAGSLWQQHFVAYVLYYLLAMFTATFVNVALFSQIIEAMNGGRVSVSRGFAVACSKLRAIIAWSIMAGAVGALLRMLQERLGFPGKWVAAFAGLSWSAASIFVIPVIIREPHSRSPLDYLRISTALVKRVWGEGIAGISSLVMPYVLLFVVFVIAMIGARSLGGSPGIQEATYFAVAVGLVSAVLYLAWQIFQCGLYVYATEGVAPGTFDEKAFDRIWVLKGDVGANDRPGANDKPKAARRVPWSRLWTVVPVAFFAIPIWLHFFPPQSRELIKWELYLGYLRVDLTKLEYKLRIEDFRAAGLFVDDKDPAKTLFSEGSFNEPPDSFNESFAGRNDGGMQPEMSKHNNQLWVHFYGEDRSAGQERMKRAAHLLQSSFPGHEKAIVFEPYIPSKTVISWPALKGATSYVLEIDCFNCCLPERWCSDTGSKWKVVTGIESTAYTFESVIAPPLRVRVWGVNASGRRGLKSPWTNFTHR